MEKKNEYHIYLAWPRYLAQWYAHEMHRMAHSDCETEPAYRYDCDVAATDLEAVHTRRGSLQRAILEMCLQKPETAADSLPEKDATICIALPHFLNKPPETYNCLRKVGKRLLLESVRNHFKIELGRFMGKMTGDIITRSKSSVMFESMTEAFMAQNGIEATETNCLAVKKTWYRIYKTQKQKEARKRKDDRQ